MKRLLSLLFFILLPFALSAKKVQVNNRVLAVVNGKPISAFDVMKKMDMFLYQNYPQYKEMPDVLYQFYNAEWKHFLLDMIDRELVLQDAAEKKFEVSSGDVREELEELFGPNVMLNVESAGLSIDEAYTLLKAEITIRRMLFMQVRNRVMAEITPSDVQNAYDVYASSLVNDKTCTWSCISIKGADDKKVQTFSEALYTLLDQGELSKEGVQKELQDKGFEQEGISITYSNEFTQKTNELAPHLQALFLSLDKQKPSRPQVMPTKSANMTTMRIYFLHDLSSANISSLEEMQEGLRDQIMQQRLEQKTREYYQALRTKYFVSKEEIEQALPQNFQPFVMR